MHYVNRGAAMFSLAVQFSLSSVAVTVQSRLLREVQRGKCRFQMGQENQQDRREMKRSSLLDGKNKKRKFAGLKKYQALNIHWMYESVNV